MGIVNNFLFSTTKMSSLQLGSNSRPLLKMNFQIRTKFSCQLWISGQIFFRKKVAKLNTLLSTRLNMSYSEFLNWSKYAVFSRKIKIFRFSKKIYMISYLGLERQNSGDIFTGTGMKKHWNSSGSLPRGQHCSTHNFLQENFDYIFYDCR